MHKDFIGWIKEGLNIETRYTVEYINDINTWEKFLKATKGHGSFEPWEYFTKKQFDNIADALSLYMTWYVNENCYLIQMMEEIVLNGETILENPIEPASTTKWSMRQGIDKEINNRLRSAENKAKEMEKINDLYKTFIERLGAKKLFEEYLKTEEK